MCKLHAANIVSEYDMQFWKTKKVQVFNEILLVSVHVCSFIIKPTAGRGVRYPLVSTLTYTEQIVSTLRELIFMGIEFWDLHQFCSVLQKFVPVKNYQKTINSLRCAKYDSSVSSKFFHRTNQVSGQTRKMSFQIFCEKIPQQVKCLSSESC